MTLPFAEVSVAREDRRYVAVTSTVRGLGGVQARKLSEFQQAVAEQIFGKHPEIGSVTISGPRENQRKTIERAPSAMA